MKTAATCIPISPDGEILLQLRDDGNGKEILYPNMWNFLGGAVEEGETHQVAAIRELEEETGIKINQQSLELIWVYDHDGVVDDHIFIVKLQKKDQPKILEGKDIRWISLFELKNLALGFGQAVIVPLLQKYFSK